jgi:hypothetical protein
VGVAPIERALDDRFDELRLCLRVGVARLEARGTEASGDAPLLGGVGHRVVGMITEIVAEGEVPTLFDAPRLTQVDVVAMGPGRGTMEKGVGGVVWVRDVRIAEFEQGAQVRIQGVQAYHRNLDVDDGLRGKAGNGCRSDVVYSYGGAIESRAYSTRFGLEHCLPTGVVRNDFDRVTGGQECTSQVFTQASARRTRGSAASRTAGRHRRGTAPAARTVPRFDWNEPLGAGCIR